MKCFKQTSLVVFLLIAQNFVFGRRSTLNIEDDKRQYFLVEPFCFAEGGTIDLQVQNFVLKYHGEQVLPTNISFLVRHLDGTTYSSGNSDPLTGVSCLQSAPGADSAVLRDFLVPLAPGDSNFSLTIDADGAGLYSILYANCEFETAATFRLALTLMNRGGVYLSAGDIPLPIVYSILGAAFLIAAVAWIVVVRAHRTSSHTIHFLMAALCLVKAASVVVEGVRLEWIRSTGEGHAWTPAYYFLAFLKGTMTFGIIVLIGTGWSFIKPFLSTRDKRILLVVLPLQVGVNTAMVVVEETPPGTAGWLAWRDALHLLDVICCCAVLFPIVASIRMLREAAEADGAARRTLHKLRLFREFYILLVVYIYFTRIVVYIVRITSPCEFSWVSRAASELATLAFFVLSGYKFRPVEGNPYLKVPEDEGQELRSSAVEPYEPGA